VPVAGTLAAVTRGLNVSIDEGLRIEAAAFGGRLRAAML
jgi:hypothetical protein